MSKKIPTMPNLGMVEEILPGEQEIVQDESFEEELPIEPKLIYNDPEKAACNNVTIPLIPKLGIAVTATRRGFFAQQRIKEGEEFIVKAFESLGDWMKCKDSELEKKRIQFLKDKKAKK